MAVPCNVFLVPKLWTGLLSQFTTVLLAFATLVGAYVGALAIDAVLLFWILVPASALCVAVWRIWPRLLEVARRSTNYARVEKELHDSRESLELAEREIGRLQEKLVTERVAGREQGREEAMGIVGAAIAGASLKVIGVAVRDGSLLVGAELQSGRMPSIGATYELAMAFTKQSQGVLKVIELSDDGDGVLLAPIQEDVPEFWQALRSQAVLTQEPPPGLILSVPSLPPLPQTAGDE